MKNRVDLGTAICIIGFSCSGKSTLALNISQKLSLPVLYLDTIAHIPYTNWQVRDRKLLKQDHDFFITNTQHWVIEGNYSFLMHDRFKLASIIIWMDYMNLSSVIRYIKRCIFKNNNRPGKLNGSSDEFNWKHLKNMIVNKSKNRSRYQELITQSGKPFIRISSLKELKSFYKDFDL